MMIFRVLRLLVFGFVLAALSLAQAYAEVVGDDGRSPSSSGATPARGSGLVTSSPTKDGSGVIDAGRHHLRSGTEPEWEDSAATPVEGKRLDIVFAARANTQPATLCIRQDDVRQDWAVELNHKRIGKLFLMEADLVHALSVPVGALRDGSNMLSIIPPRENDDIWVGDIRLDMHSPAEALSAATLTVKVRDQRRELMPSRVTIVNADGALAPLLRLSNAPPAAVRPGVIYSAGETSVGLPPGDYTVFASRGFEWSVATQRVHVAAGPATGVELLLRREVATPGLVSCDTHIHIMSNHGDATVDERALTLAGEGIEMPIATEHNTNVSFAAPANRMHVDNYFTPVIGTEVTTIQGHFNVFPIVPGPAPNFRLTDWPKLMENLRDTPGVQVVILNHPRNVHNNFQPFAETNYNEVTGENLRGFEFSFDAMELVNSSAEQSDYMLVFREWFGLLNYGYRIAGVGSSDGHDVSRYIVGQGRTYIRCRDDDPSRIPVNDACQNLRRSRALVSMGLLVDMKVNDKFEVGDLVTNPGRELTVSIRVAAPSWITATNVSLYGNGILLRGEPLPGIHETNVTWRLPKPQHDMHLVAIATGPGVTAPFWAIPRPYQPVSKRWEGRVIAATNPIWVDTDGDGEFTPARRYAQRLVKVSAGDHSKLEQALKDYDGSVRAQVERSRLPL